MPTIHHSPSDTATQEETGGSRRLFDIRLVIGGLFAVYGVLLTVTGALDGSRALRKAQGLNLNLWTGIGMLAVAAVFLVWMRLRPLALAEPGPQQAHTPDSESGSRQG
ncbi:hypothetical protein [Peterkaempfera griseoplana]|uniref:hypothetical protein n=1 Tax=Peterkaempfera griseoplana TaxID=66896 RepID=UPI0006E3B46C|nr:hypothetical protein [Peterkaempfera griseoplana]